MDNLSDVETPEAGDGAGQESSSPEVDFGVDEYKHENGKFFGKFDDIKSMAGGYRELEKEFTKKNQEYSKLTKEFTSPDKYELELDEDIKDMFEFDENNPDYQMYIPMFKELGLSNSKVNKLVNAYAHSKIDESNVDFEEELKKVGGERGDVINSIKSFMHKNPDISQTISDRAKTADDMQLIYDIIRKSKNITNIPDIAYQGEETQKSKQDWLDEAHAYQESHKNSIGYNEEQQAEYMRLMQKSV